MTELRRGTESVPVVCDMSNAPDTIAERLEEYRQLFATSLVGRHRTDTGIRFRLRGDATLPAHVHDLAAREHACCAFFAFTVAEVGAEVHWDASVADDDAARRVLDEFYALPDRLA